MTRSANKARDAIQFFDLINPSRLFWCNHTDYMFCIGFVDMLYRNTTFVSRFSSPPTCSQTSSNQFPKSRSSRDTSQNYHARDKSHAYTTHNPLLPPSAYPFSHLLA